MSLIIQRGCSMMEDEVLLNR